MADRAIFCDTPVKLPEQEWRKVAACTANTDPDEALRAEARRRLGDG